MGTAGDGGRVWGEGCEERTRGIALGRDLNVVNYNVILKIVRQKSERLRSELHFFLLLTISPFLLPLGTSDIIGPILA